MRPSERERRDVNAYRGRVFDVLPSTDDQSLEYPVRPLLASVVEPRRRVWRRGAVLDQGQEGACVGFGVTQELISTPVRVQFDEAKLPAAAPRRPQPFAFWLYHQAQRIDEWAGEGYSGTSVNAGMKMARNLGLIDSYRWAQTREDFRDTLVSVGPVVIAIPWHSGMYEAPGGELRVSGQQVGWHCILVNGYDPSLAWNGQPRREMARLINSWGRGWGDYGSAWMTFDALWHLIDDNDGEMVVPIGRHLSAP